MSNPNADCKIVPDIGDEVFVTEPEIHKLVSRALNHARRFKTRKKIAEELSAVTGSHVTERMVNDWSAESKVRVRVPAIVIAPLAKLACYGELSNAIMTNTDRALVEYAGQKLELRGLIATLRRAVGLTRRLALSAKTKGSRSQKVRRARR